MHGSKRGKNLKTLSGRHMILKYCEFKMIILILLNNLFVKTLNGIYNRNSDQTHFECCWFFINRIPSWRYKWFKLVTLMCFKLLWSNSLSNALKFYWYKWSDLKVLKIHLKYSADRVIQVHWWNFVEDWTKFCCFSCC